MKRETINEAIHLCECVAYDRLNAVGIRDSEILDNENDAHKDVFELVWAVIETVFHVYYWPPYGNQDNLRGLCWLEAAAWLRDGWRKPGDELTW